LAMGLVKHALPVLMVIGQGLLQRGSICDQRGDSGVSTRRARTHQCCSWQWCPRRWRPAAAPHRTCRRQRPNGAASTCGGKGLPTLADRRRKERRAAAPVIVLRVHIGAVREQRCRRRSVAFVRGIMERRPPAVQTRSPTHRSAFGVCKWKCVFVRWCGCAGAQVCICVRTRFVDVGQCEGECACVRDDNRSCV
jgi:hypothetical protein